jgi:NitT/TauT family transport system permease protein
MTLDATDPGLERFSSQIETARRRAARNRTFGRLIQFASVIGLLIAWELAVVILRVDPIIVPRVSVIAESFWAMTVDGTIIWHTLVTVRRVLIGFAAAAVLGVGVGAAMVRFHGVRNFCDPLIAGLYPLPKIALIPLLIIWFGSGESYKFVIVVTTAFFPVVISTFQGLRQVDSGLIATARDLGADEWRIQKEVMLPAAMPAILSGMRLATGVAIILTIASEMIASQDGLGQVLVAVGAILETEKVFAILFAVAIVGIAITKVHDWVDMKLAGWALDDDKK